MGLVIVYGPPCGGKSTYVATHKAPGDLVLDYDAVCSALTGLPMHTLPPWDARPYVLAAMNSVLKEWRRRPDRPENLWLIRTWLSDGDLVGAQRSILLDPGREVCLSRAEARPQARKGIERWYSSTQGVESGSR